MNPKSPEFFCIGAQKAGTGWLRHNLRQHPQIWMPPKSEMHYFDNRLDGSPILSEAAIDRTENEIWRAEQARSLPTGDILSAAWWALHNSSDLSDKWYRSLFAFAPTEAVAGDITPRYMLCNKAQIEHMHHISPNAKLIFLLRNPVERFLSQCRMKIADGSLAVGDAAAMQLFDTFIGRPRGEYSKAILRFCEVFPPENMLLVFFDGIVREPVSVLESIYAFLGLPALTIDPVIAQTPIHQTEKKEPVSSDLSDRLRAAYRAEISALATVFGGYPVGWMSEESREYSSAVVQVSREHIRGLKRQSAERIKLKNQRNSKVFCLSMQRSGTTSVGDWLEAHGFQRSGSPTSVRLEWTRKWLAGDFDAIFSSAEFIDTEIFEDDPWWCPNFYKAIHLRYPTAKFILLERQPEEWFQSLCHHSRGRNPGDSDIHARIYRREEELGQILADNSSLQACASGLLSIIEHRDHYIQIYQQHIAAVRAFFTDMPQKLFYGRLEEPDVFPMICDFLGVQADRSILVPRSNVSTEEMRYQLDNRLREYAQ